MSSWKFEFFQQDPNIHRKKTKIKHLFLTQLKNKYFVLILRQE